MNNAIIACTILASFIAGSSSALGGADEEPKHLTEARKLVEHLDLKNTSYAHGTPEVQFRAPYKSHTDCSGFHDALLEHSYGYTPSQFRKWFGAKRPTADLYHDAIVKQHGFDDIKDFHQVKAGDILAVKYSKPKDKSTGHLMLVADKPRPMKIQNSIKPGLEQWEVEIIDSAKSGHGSMDKRHKSGEKDHDGLGQGSLGIYTDREGRIAGFTWSVGGTKFLDQHEENMVVGRLKNLFKP